MEKVTITLFGYLNGKNACSNSFLSIAFHQLLVFFFSDLSYHQCIFPHCRYKDASKTSFKSSTRLECMMQDYPKTLPPSARVGFTVNYLFEKST